MSFLEALAIVVMFLELIQFLWEVSKWMEAKHIGVTWQIVICVLLLAFVAGLADLLMRLT